MAAMVAVVAAVASRVAVVMVGSEEMEAMVAVDMDEPHGTTHKHGHNPSRHEDKQPVGICILGIRILGFRNF